MSKVSPPLVKDSTAKDHQRLKHHGGFDMKSLFVSKLDHVEVAVLDMFLVY